MTVPSCITSEDVARALALPERARVDQRVPKKLLAEHGASTAADRRLLTDSIEELQWVAALKPGTVAIPEHRSAEREYLEVAVLAVQVRATHARASQLWRLVELVHRAIPYPVVLIQSLVASTALSVSMIHKRAAQNEAGKVVVDGELVRSEIVDAAGTPVPHADALLEAMALDRQPHQDLMALYQGWMNCLTAAEAARLTGSFRPRTDPGEAAAQREALRHCQRLEQERVRLLSQAAKERQIARQVDLNLTIQRLQAELQAARARL
jgi:hypothetical protein